MTTQSSKNTSITFKVEQNEKYGDWRVSKYVDGEWVNEREGNWTKKTAEKKAYMYTQLAKDGSSTMSDAC